MLPHGRRLASLRLCIEKHSDSYKSACCNAGRHPSFGTGRSQSFMIPSEVDTHTVFADVLCLNRVSFFAWLRCAWGMPTLWPSHLMCENAEVRLYIYATDPEAEEDEQDAGPSWLLVEDVLQNRQQNNAGHPAPRAVLAVLCSFFSVHSSWPTAPDLQDSLGPNRAKLSLGATRSLGLHLVSSLSFLAAGRMQNASHLWCGFAHHRTHHVCKRHAEPSVKACKKKQT